jgi:hypothetical protein
MIKPVSFFNIYIYIYILIILLTFNIGLIIIINSRLKWSRQNNFCLDLFELGCFFFF